MIPRIAAPFVPCGEGGTGLSRWHSLSAQLFLDVLRSLMAAAVVFILLFWAGVSLLDRTVYNSSFVDGMADRQFERLQEYVTEQGVTEDNLRPLDIWCGRGDRRYLVLYLDGQLLYESYYTSLGMEDAPAENYDPDYEDPEREYPLTLSDGTETQAFFYYYMGRAYYYWNAVLSGLGAFLVFSLCFIYFVHRKLRYVQQLKGELDILAGGDLTYPVTVQGKDELGELAAGIDQMRRSILAHRTAEEHMRQANSELVTAMSHDLRTPLTSLMAYLELMERGKYEDQEQLAHFIRRSLEKTRQIKSMADKLFEYFLVYTAEWEPPDLEQRDADELLQHLLGEYAFSLENRGFAVERNFETIGGQVRVNLELMRRVFDNLYGNLLKYADPDSPVEISYRREGEQIQITLCNRISPARDKVQSTNIGLNTCSKILNCHSGTFIWEEDKNFFRTEITLPLL